MLELTVGSRLARTDRPALIMGIVNATPDSFFPGSRGGAELALRLIDEGADILDIGGESTRPGYEEVSVQEELERIIPVIRAVRRVSDIPISVDTRKASVFFRAAEEGADAFNDVSALEDDAGSAQAVARTGASVILMHRFKGDEAARKTSPAVTEDVSSYLEQRVQLALDSGIPARSIIVDPGIGFGKTFEENLELIRNAGSLCGGAYPVLMALSRKRCIGTMTGRDAEDRLYGTLAANLFAVQRGAKIIRVHDVKASFDALNVMKYLDYVL